MKNSKHPSPTEIINWTSLKYGVTPDALKARHSPTSDIHSIRDEAIYKIHQLCRRSYQTEKRLTFARIGEIMGGRHHATIIHSIKKHQKKMSKKPSQHQQFAET